MELIEHIAIFDKAVPDSLCKQAIDFFDTEEALKLTWQRPNRNNTKEDLSLDGTELVRLHTIGSHAPSFIIETMGHFWECYNRYTDKYQVLNGAQPHFVAEVKWQRTRPTQGFHVWHAENVERVHSNRVATFILYLNDVHEGGETEFLYQSLRVKPETGKLVIWPAAYTHAHRGNPPLKETKYIMTGWLEFGNIV